MPCHSAIETRKFTVMCPRRSLVTTLSVESRLSRSLTNSLWTSHSDSHPCPDLCLPEKYLFFARWVFWKYGLVTLIKRLVDCNDANHYNLASSVSAYLWPCCGTLVSAVSCVKGRVPVLSFYIQVWYTFTAINVHVSSQVTIPGTCWGVYRFESIESSIIAC